jgi:hypothetical protein
VNPDSAVPEPAPTPAPPGAEPATPAPLRADTPALPAGPVAPTRRAPPENLWLNLGFNAAAPALILTFLSAENRLGPAGALVMALLFPLGYGLWDLWKRRIWNLLSALGLTGTLITGGLGLLKMSGFWFAVKEAALPVLLGLALPWSLRTRQPLVKTLLYNDQVLNTARIADALAARGTETRFNALLARASWVLAVALLVSALINFFLAWWLLPAVSGTDEFNRQLARLQLWSWPGSFVPMAAGMFYALARLLKGLEELTGLRGEELFHARTGRQR